MNAVEIEQAVSALAETPFDASQFPYAFLEAFGNKPTTIKILRSGKSNNTDVEGAVLQRNNIHIKTCHEGAVSETLKQLRQSPATARQKSKFILATDGRTLESERLIDGETLACDFSDLPNRFTFFLPLAGISTVRQIDENAFDIRATSRLNRLYVELLKTNPGWDSEARREEMNHFFARLIFCFFAEDTKIFHTPAMFTATVEQMSDRDSSNTHEVIAQIFRAMQVNSNSEDRKSERMPSWANKFPYVNGGLFSGSLEVPRFSKIARSYLLHVGNLDWTKINPDIFGSMIQAVADDEERGALGMHYTSVPNILKVLNPLFLDELRERLSEAGVNSRKLLNLRNRLARIRVFDPACGSGNFLVIAYKEMRAIEAEINKRRGEADRSSEIPLTNFRGIEIRHFSCEIARLALIIAEYQCDVLYRGERLALAEFLPLEADNWITCGNALRLDWLSICPPAGEVVKYRADDLFSKPVDQPEVGFENEGGETYVCGNPQFKGARKQTKEQKADMSLVFEGHNDFKDCDYVAAWYLKAANFTDHCHATFAFVSTSSICEGEQVAHLWSRLYSLGCHIIFAHEGFRWQNNAAKNAVVQCVIIGVSKNVARQRAIYSASSVRHVQSISPYLTAGDEIFVTARNEPISASLGQMVSGSMPRDGGNLILSVEEANELISDNAEAKGLLKYFVGSQELVHGQNRMCLWVEDSQLSVAKAIGRVNDRIERVRQFRLDSSAKTTNGYASTPHKFAQRAHVAGHALVVAKTSSETRAYLPADVLQEQCVVSDAAFAVYRPSFWEFSIVVSRLHLVWIATVCGRLETRYRYSSTLGWNTFPVPTLTEQNKADLIRCAEEILLAREAHFPATIADLYDPENMPKDLREAHERNDEVIERIYIGRRFKNDTERLEKLFAMYTQLIAKQASHRGADKPAGRRRAGTDA